MKMQHKLLQKKSYFNIFNLSEIFSFLSKSLISLTVDSSPNLSRGCISCDSEINLASNNDVAVLYINYTLKSPSSSAAATVKDKCRI